jgi:hypothetical protein
MDRTTQTEAIRLEVVSSFSFRIAINLSRICGIPKYPRPHASAETIGRKPKEPALPEAAS